jgi:hypothetical protein
MRKLKTEASESDKMMVATNKRQDALLRQVEDVAKSLGRTREMHEARPSHSSRVLSVDCDCSAGQLRQSGACCRPTPDVRRCMYLTR